MTSIKTSDQHDEIKRGKWSSSIDFVTANIGFSLGFKHFGIWSIVLVGSTGTNFFIPYIVAVIAYSIPIFFIQSFLGQFSSSGVISAYRITPLFKGIGYLILLLNFCSISYFTVHSAISLAFFFNTVNPNIAGIGCNPNIAGIIIDWNSPNCTKSNEDVEFDDWFCGATAWPSCENEYYSVSLENNEKLDISWRIVYSTLLVWILIGSIVVTKAQTIGKIIRFTTMIIIIILFAILIRFVTLPSASNAFIQFLVPEWKRFLDPLVWAAAAITAILTFGGGFGITLTLASFNKFKTDIGKFSILTNMIQIILFIITGLITAIVHEYIRHNSNIRFVDYGTITKVLYKFSIVFKDIPGGYLWSILFLLMIFLGDLLVCIIQVFTILTAFMDECITLRYYRKNFTAILLIIMYFISLVFSFYEGFYQVKIISNSVTQMQILTCFTELMIVLWVYGASRFQRDVIFMFGKKPFSKLFINIIRISLPLVILALFVYYFIHTRLSLTYDHLTICLMHIIEISATLIIPIYMIYKLLKSTGSFRQRVINRCKPKKWWPAVPEEQIRYNEFIDNNVTFERI